MKRLLLALFLGTLPLSSFAQARPAYNLDIASVPRSRCTVQAVTGRMGFQAIGAVADIATGSLPLLHEIEQINRRAKDNGRPIRETLSQPDLIRFTELSQRLKVNTVGQYIESRRERDASVLQRLVEIADQEYRFADTTSNDAHDADLRAFLQGMRQYAIDQNWQIMAPAAPGGVCSFRLAVHTLAAEALGKVDENTYARDLAGMQAIASRYGMKSVEVEKLSAADQAEFGRLREESQATTTAYNYVIDLSNIAYLADTMDISYSSMKQDFIVGGGDEKQLGHTADRMLRDGEIPAQQQMGFRVLGMINEKIPADVVTRLEQVKERTIK